MATFLKEDTKLHSGDKNVRPQVQVRGGQRYIIIDDMAFDVAEPDATVLAFSSNKWPNGEVFYEYASNLTKTMKEQFENACEEWSSVSAVKFTPRNDQIGYIYVENASGNEASIGYAPKKRLFTMHDWSSLFIIVHELGHTLGLSHEHCRSDRDKYINIHKENIPDDKEHNFESFDTVNYSEYDFESVMHYRTDTWAYDGKKSISAKPEYKDKEKLMGQRKYLSERDKADMAAHYGAPQTQDGTKGS